jgi:hypothetical protein
MSVENIDTMTAYGAAYHGYWVEVSVILTGFYKGNSKLRNPDILAGHYPAEPSIR